MAQDSELGLIMKKNITTRMVREAAEMVNIGAPDLKNRKRMVRHVLNNMVAPHNTKYLIAGSTGIGKTTFVKQLCKLLGLNMILIEVPHIVEEQIINIPFIVFDQGAPKGKVMNQSFKAEEKNGQPYTVVLGQSFLANELHKAKKIPDAQYMARLKQDPAVFKLFQTLGGTETSIPEEIQSIREKYNVVLFLDEYYRRTSNNVRNILRTILNGQIGNDKMPPHTYVMYASNLEDVGQTVENIPMNADHKRMTFKAPTKNEWFHYFMDTFSKDTHVALKPEVVNAFYAALTDDQLSYNDLKTEIRTSPRRWEQLMLYVNANTPVKDASHAAALLANVKANFQNEDAVSTMHTLVDNIVRQIIHDTGTPNLAKTKALDSSEWRNTLYNQIATKIKLGDHRKYVPVVSGLPGIGKTSIMKQIADKLNLRLISIDCSTISPDSVTGILIPEITDNKPSGSFSQPSLLQKINNEATEADAHFENSASAEQVAAYKKQKFKYLLFFDELSRVSNTTVFNSLRRVLLDKSFSDKELLPPGTIMVAAMNPHDKRGVQELTGHIKDSIDILHASPSWKAFQAHMDNFINTKLSHLNPQAVNITKTLMQEMQDELMLKSEDKDSNISHDDKQFYMRIGNENIYLSPREMESMFADVAAGLHTALKEGKNMDPEELKEELISLSYELMEQTLGLVIENKHEIKDPQQLVQLQSRIRQTFDSILEKKVESADLGQMLDSVLNNHDMHLKDDPNFINKIKNFDANKFSEELVNYLSELIQTEEQHPIHALITHTHPSKQLVKRAVIKGDQNALSKIEYLQNEIKIACEAHNVAGDVADVVKQSVRNILGKFMNPRPTKDQINAAMAKL
jgi:MoxR-like ATPase